MQKIMTAYIPLLLSGTTKLNRVSKYLKAQNKLKQEQHKPFTLYKEGKNM
jgi:hypothetical protein